MDKIDFNSVCRTCLCDGTKLEPILSLKSKDKCLRDILQDVASIQFEENDGLPSNICSTCVKTVYNFFEFRESCRVIQETLVRQLDKREQDQIKFDETIDVKQEVNDDTIHKDESLNHDQDLKVKNESVDELPPKRRRKRIGVKKTRPKLRKIHKGEKVEAIENNNPDKGKTTDEDDKKNQYRQCERCGKVLKHGRSFNEHVLTHTGIRPHMCKICAKTFIKSGHLSRHMLIHSGETPFACGICGKKFRQKSAMTTHERVVHRDERPFLCQICGRPFAQKAQLESHMYTHTGEKPHKCDMCGKGFARSGDLKMHRSYHDAERPYSCATCGKQFTREADLHVHESRHDDTHKTYACHLCTHRFRYRGGLREHLLRHSGNFPFKCDICDVSFLRRLKLTMHMNRVHDKQLPSTKARGKRKLEKNEPERTVDASETKMYENLGDETLLIENGAIENGVVFNVEQPLLNIADTRVLNVLNITRDELNERDITIYIGASEVEFNKINPE